MTSRKCKLLLDSLSNVCDFLQDILDNKHHFLHHMYLIHQTFFSSLLKKKRERENKKRHWWGALYVKCWAGETKTSLSPCYYVWFIYWMAHNERTLYVFRLVLLKMRQTRRQCSGAVMWMAERFQLLSGAHNSTVAQEQHNQDSLVDEKYTKWPSAIRQTRWPRQEVQEGPRN